MDKNQQCEMITTSAFFPELHMEKNNIPVRSGQIK